MSRQGQSQNVYQTPKPISQLVTKKMPPDPIPLKPMSEKKAYFSGVPYKEQPRRPIILSDITSSHQHTQNKIGQNTISKAMIPCTATSVTAHGLPQQHQNGQIRMNYNGRNENMPIKQVDERVKSSNQTANQNVNSTKIPPQSQTSLNNNPQKGQNNKGNSQTQQKQFQQNQVQQQQQQQQQQFQQQYNPLQMLQNYQQQIARQMSMQPQQSMTMQQIPPQFQQQVMAHLMRQRMGNMGGNMNLGPQYRQQQQQQQQPQRFVRLANNVVMPVYNHPFNPANNPMSILPLQQLANNEHEIQYCIGKPFMLGSPGLGAPSYVADLGHFKILGVD